MFKNIKLRTQLNSGFAAVIVLLIIVASTAWWGLQGSFDGFTEYRRLARMSNEIADFQDRMLNARLAFRGFMLKQDDEQVRAYREHFSRMADALKTLKEKVKNPERLKLVASIDEQINKYDETFTQVIAFEKQRVETIKGLVEAGTAIQKIMLDMMEAATRDNNAEAVALAGRLQTQFMEWRYFGLRYIMTRQRADFD